MINIFVIDNLTNRMLAQPYIKNRKELPKSHYFISTFAFNFKVTYLLLRFLILKKHIFLFKNSMLWVLNAFLEKQTPFTKISARRMWPDSSRMKAKVINLKPNPRTHFRGSGTLTLGLSLK